MGSRIASLPVELQKPIFNAVYTELRAYAMKKTGASSDVAVRVGAQDPAAAVRLEAVRALARKKRFPADFLTQVLSLCDDPSPHVRVEAVTLLGRSDTLSDESIATLRVRTVKDPETSVRLEALRILGRHKLLTEELLVKGQDALLSYLKETRTFREKASRMRVFEIIFRTKELASNFVWAILESQERYWSINFSHEIWTLDVDPTPLFTAGLRRGGLKTIHRFIHALQSHLDGGTVKPPLTRQTVSEFLDNALQHEDYEVRRGALYILSSYVTPSLAAPVAARALRFKNKNVSESALRLLKNKPQEWESARSDVIPHLLEYAAASDHTGIQADTIQLLVILYAREPFSKSLQERFLTVCREGLESGHGVVCLYSFHGLTLLGDALVKLDPTSVSEMIPVLIDSVDKPYAKSHALRVLIAWASHISGPNATRLRLKIKPILTERNEYLRKQAKKLLDQLQNK